MRCEKCGTGFEQRRLTQRFCSNECKFDSRRQQLDRRCQVCGAVFSVPPHRSAAKYCSDACRVRGGTREVTTSAKMETWNNFVSRRSKKECWPWKGVIHTTGYGSFRIGSKFQAYAHRISYELFVGDIPEGTFVCHKCDNRPCCNPDHLFLGSSADNSRDMVKKGRQSFGVRRPKSKLNDELVREIRSSPLSQGKLAKIYGVNPSIISMVVRRKTWRHVRKLEPVETKKPRNAANG